MSIRDFTKLLIVSTLVCTGSVYGGEAPKAVAPEKTPDAENVASKPIPKDEAMAEIEASRRRIMEMKEPRDKHMAAVGELNQKIEARRKAILEENKDAAKLSAEIAELEKALQEKAGVLKAVFDSDKELSDLQSKMQAERENFGKNQLKLREEIARQHRERRLAEEKAAKEKQAGAAKEAGDK